MQILTSPGHELRVAMNGAAADRTLTVDIVEEIEGLGTRRPLRFDHFHHRWNHFARFLDHDGVADANVFAPDFIFVVQSGPGHAAAADGDRLQVGHGRQNSGPTHLDEDIVEPGLDSYRFVFVSNGPTRRLGREAESFALVE